MENNTKPIITGGAWGTELQKCGLPVGEISDLWNLSHPKAIKDLTQSYYKVGTHVQLTNSFQSNRIVFERLGQESKLEQCIRAGVRFFRNGGGPNIRLFGSIGPALLNNEAVSSEAGDAFKESASLLAEEGVQALVLETMIRFDEAECALNAISNIGLPIVVSFIANHGHLFDGASINDAIRMAEQYGVNVIGLNCMTASKILEELPAIRGITRLPIWAKPNAGIPKTTDGKPNYQYSADRFAQDAQELVNAGAAYIGGCCGVGPEHIAAFSSKSLSNDSTEARQLFYNGLG